MQVDEDWLPFLTSYDPSDLPGSSVDPLGFDRGYLFLADKLLPGLTNVADRPRYFEVLCAGASLVDERAPMTPRQLHQARLDCVLRLERLWALACVLASRQGTPTGNPNDVAGPGGLRGVTYVQTHAERVTRERRTRVDAEFPMLLRQVRYGAVGIYGTVANTLRLWDRKTLQPTPDLGLTLAQAFLSNTEAPEVLLRAVRAPRDVSLESLIAWGRRAHIARAVGPEEQRCFRQALVWDPVRKRMAEALLRVPAKDGENEIARLGRIAQAIDSDDGNRDLSEAVEAIVAYEGAYRLVLLGFERLLRLARTLPAGDVAASDLRADPVLGRVCSYLPAAVGRFERSIEDATTTAFRGGIERLSDIAAFLIDAARACVAPVGLAEAIIARHADVQRGKFDRGRRKMPWMEWHTGRLALTMSRIGGLDFEATRPDDIQPHPYRLFAANSLIEAAGIA